MAQNPAKLADIERLLLVVADGIEFPGAMVALRTAGFDGAVRAVSYRDWTVIIEGKCEQYVPLASTNSSNLKRHLSLVLKLLKHRRWADAIVWVSPRSDKARRLIGFFSKLKPLYCFYDGQAAPFDPKKQPGQPGIQHVGGTERELAVKYLRSSLRQKRKTRGTIRLGVDGDGIHAREATGVQWVRRHFLAALCEDEMEIDLVVTSPVTEARTVWELPWSNKMRRIPPAIATYKPNNRDEAIPVETITGPIDLFHLTFFDPPVFAFDKVVATVYDIMPLVIPDQFPQRFIDRLKAIEPFWKNECDRIICISEYTRNDLERVMGIPKSKTLCIYPARHPHFSRRSAGDIARVLKRYGIRQPYLMTLGSIAPHKNLHGLCEAFALVKQRTKIPHQLVIIGRPAWLMRGIFEEVEKNGIASDVVFTGYADWEDLPALYSGAEAFCMPSFYEGYGLPVQEAMCCGCPVLLSDCTSLPEVAGDAGIYWDPHDTENMAEVIRNFTQSQETRAQAQKNVLKHAETFMTWREVALAHREVYEEVLIENNVPVTSHSKKIRLGLIVDEKYYTEFLVMLGKLLRATDAIEPIILMCRDDAPDPQNGISFVRFTENRAEKPSKTYDWEDLLGYEQSLVNVDKYFEGRHETVAHSLAAQAEKWFEAGNVDCLVEWSGTRLATRTIAAAAHACNIPVVTLESPYFQKLPEPPEQNVVMDLHRMKNNVLIWDTVQAPQCGPSQLTRDWTKAEIRPGLQVFLDKLHKERISKFSQEDIKRFLTGKADAKVNPSNQPDPAIELNKPPGMKALLVCGQVDRDSSMFFGNHLVLDWYDLAFETAKRLPQGWIMWFKGHPLDRKYDSGVEQFAEELLAINPMCKVLPTTIDIHLAYQHCDAVICINSTAGIEAMTYKIPVINLGQASYTHKGMTYTLSDLNQLSETIANLPPTMTAEQIEIRDRFLSYVLYEYLIPVGSPRRMLERIHQAIAEHKTIK